MFDTSMHVHTLEINTALSKNGCFETAVETASLSGDRFLGCPHSRQFDLISWVCDHLSMVVLVAFRAQVAGARGPRRSGRQQVFRW